MWEELYDDNPQQKQKQKQNFDNQIKTEKFHRTVENYQLKGYRQS
jgi:hypothetical protein